MDSNSQNDTVKIAGHDFRKVDGGVDEKQVRLIVEELMADRDKLLKRQEHLSSLTWAFEKVVADADDLADEMKQNAKEQAQAAAKAILAGAEDNARRITETKKLEAEKEVDILRANAQEEVGALLQHKVSEIQFRMRDSLQQLLGKTLVHLDNFKNEVMVLEADLKREVEALGTVTGVPPEIHETTAVTAVASSEIVPESSDMKDSMEIVEQVSEADVEWTELEILPPRDKESIERIKAHLDTVSGVTSTAILPGPDKTLIEVSTNRPLDLAKILLSFPEVGGVKEMNTDKQNRIGVELSIKSELERDRDSINRLANRFASQVHPVRV